MMHDALYTSDGWRPAADGECRRHCWHAVGVIFTTLPAMWQEVCCWCGARRTVAHTGGAGDHHGPFHVEEHRG